jgi:hypothetical protein
LKASMGRQEASRSVCAHALPARVLQKGITAWDYSTSSKACSTPGTPDPPDASRLKGESVTALAASLKSLRVGQRGWITLREAWHLFSPVDDEEEAFGELDDEGRENWKILWRRLLTEAMLSWVKT